MNNLFKKNNLIINIMVDHIKQKYRRNNFESAFNEFNDTKIIEKTNCKPCIISYLCFTILNTIYLLPITYFYYNFKEYTSNNIFHSPENFNDFINNLKYNFTS